MAIDFSDNLRKAMAHRKVTQAWLADKANQKEATISRYVNGVNKSPQIDILVEIAKALNVSTDYLLGISNVPVTTDNLSHEELLLIYAFERASKRDAAIVWQILEDYLTIEEKGDLSALEQKTDQAG